MARQNFATDSPFEPVVGYSRAVRSGNQVFVTGTTAPEEKGEYAPDRCDLTQDRGCAEALRSGTATRGPNAHVCH